MCILPNVNSGCKLWCVILMPAIGSGLPFYHVHNPCMTGRNTPNPTHSHHDDQPSFSMVKTSQCSVMLGIEYLSSAINVDFHQPHAIAATCGVGTFKGAVFSRSHSRTAPDILGDAFSHTSL